MASRPPSSHFSSSMARQTRLRAVSPWTGAQAAPALRAEARPSVLPTTCEATSRATASASLRAGSRTSMRSSFFPVALPDST